jgi:glycosyltransferase involved in cell wall biosynthesis
MKQLSRSSGGLSSALDLAETMFALKHDVHVCISSPTPTGRKHQHTTLPAKIVCEIPSSYRTLGSIEDQSFIDILRDKKASARARIWRCLRFLRRRNVEQNFKRLLNKADLIFDFENFTADAIQKIRKSSNAKLVRNHAGAPETFEEYWVKDEHLNTPESSPTARYIEYCKRYDLLLFQAVDQASDCIKRDSALRSNCYILSPSCSETDVLAAKQLPNPYRSEKKILVSVGSLQPRKAQHTTLEIFKELHKKHPEAELHFLGGREKSEYGLSLKKSISQMGLEKTVFFHGFQRDYLRWMAHAHILIQTSLSEGVSRVLRESMLMHLPIVSFSISGTGSVLRANEDALLLEPGDIAGMTSAISYLLNDSKAAQTISNSAYNRYLLNHSWAKYAYSVNQMIADFSKRG